MKVDFKFDYYPCGAKTVTGVTIVVDGDKLPLCGASICLPGDKFDMEKGQRLAIARAVTHCDREVRKQVFAAYEAKTPPLPDRESSAGGGPWPPQVEHVCGNSYVVYSDLEAHDLAKVRGVVSATRGERVITAVFDPRYRVSEIMDAIHEKQVLIHGISSG